MSVHLARERAVYGGASRHLPTLRRDLAQVQEQLSTGRRVNRASDDPGAFAQARSLESLERRYGQYERSIGAARLWTDHTQDALDRLSELFTQAGEEGLRGLNDTLSQANRDDLADRIDALLGETVDALNTRVDGEYLFGGTRTDQAPVDAAGDVTGDLSGERVRRVGPGVDLAVNAPGSRVLVFGQDPDTGADRTVTGALRNLSAALRDPDADPALDDAVADVQAARDHLIERGAEAGGTARRLGLVADQVRDGRLLAAGRRSELEDTDYFEAASRLQQTQTALEASLKAMSTTMRTTLVDLLR